MTISLVETVGSASANSFVSVAVADAYLEARLNASAWTGTEPKKQALIEATREISAMAFTGYRVDEVQALSWPRFNAPNPDGSAAGGAYGYYGGYSSTAVFDTTVIPQRIKDATCELALEFLKAGTTDIAVSPSTTGITEETVGPLTTRYAEPEKQEAGIWMYPRIVKLLAPLLENAAGQVRLTR